MASLSPEGRCTLPKVERIYLKRSIDRLFAEGRAFLVYPLRVVYLHDEEVLSARGQMMVAVGKKYFKRANKRNRVKRLVREAYRQNKHGWLAVLEERGLYGRVAFSSVAKELPTYVMVDRAMRKALQRLVLALNDVAE